MELGEVFHGEASASHQAERQGVTHHQLGGGAARRGKVVGEGLVADRDIEDEVGLLGEIAVAVAHDGDDGVAPQLDERDQDLDLRRLTAFREQDDEILVADDAQVAMDGIGGVHEHGGGPRRVHGRRDLLGDDGAFPDAGENDISLVLKHQINGLCEIIIEVGDYVFYRISLVFNDLSRNIIYFFKRKHFFFVFLA